MARRELRHDRAGRQPAGLLNPQVYWPAVDFHFHDSFGSAPLSGVISVGVGLLVGNLVRAGNRTSG